MESNEEENDSKYSSKKRKRENENKDKSEKKGTRKTKQKILNEYYNLTPVIKIKNNVRLVEPYEFKYQLYIKRRWLGKKILDVLDSEFHAFSKEYYAKAIEDGKILINNKKVTNDYILKDNDFLTHLTIRKENPIIYKKLDIIFEDDNYFVVDKPSSWPVHVCGGYNFNTLQRILMDEYKYKDVKILHRLDKQTSGVVIFSKNKESAEIFRNKLHTDDIQKIYFARVKGDFEPKDKRVICKKYIKILDKSRGIHTEVSDTEVENYFKNKTNEKEGSKINLKKQIIKNDDNNNGDKLNNIEENIIGENKIIDLEEKGKNVKNEEINKYDEKNEPKNAETEFEFLFYDEKSNTSVVKCYPKTGRTHQIRIHLNSLGFPIANDPCYGGIIYNDLKEFENPELKEYLYNSDNKNDNNVSVSDLFCYKIWLHAWSYKFDKYEFKTKEPDWAKKDYIIEHKF